MKGEISILRVPKLNGRTVIPREGVERIENILRAFTCPSWQVIPREGVESRVHQQVPDHEVGKVVIPREGVERKKNLTGFSGSVRSSDPERGS